MKNGARYQLRKQTQFKLGSWFCSLKENLMNPIDFNQVCRKTYILF